jgi:hypothetical protein
MQRSDFIRLFLFSLLPFAVCSPAACQAIADFSTDYAGVHYTMQLTAEQLASAREWRDDEANPPLPVRDAMLAARTHLKQLFDNGDKWELTTVTLKPIRDRWVYEISFEAPPPPGYNDHIAFPFVIVVLMDGNILPTVTSPSKLLPPVAKQE